MGAASRRAIATCFAFGAAGCAFASSFDGLTGSTELPIDSGTKIDSDVAPPDAAPDASDSLPVDSGTLDADTSDASEGDGGFCTQHPDATFCSDFESPTLLGWSFPVNVLGSSALSDAGFYSPTHSVRFFRPMIPQDGGTYSSGSLLRIFPNKPTSRIRTQFKFKVNDLARDFSFFAVNMGNYSYRIRLNKGGPIFREDVPVEGGPATLTATSLGIPAQLDVWVHVIMQVDFASDGGASSMVNVSFDGVSVLKDHALKAHQYIGPVQVETGILFADYTATAQEVFVDDLLVDIK